VLEKAGNLGGHKRQLCQVLAEFKFEVQQGGYFE
jgi:hypothetical protein